MINELLINENDVLITDDYENDIRNIIKMSQLSAYRAVNIVLLKRNWLIGKRIYDEELKGKRAGYGSKTISSLSISLSNEFGKGFSKTNLYSFYVFYKLYPNIFQSLSGKSKTLLNWTHYSVLITIFDSKARDWYEKECISQNWSVRNLKRNVESQYYYRLLKNQAFDNPRIELSREYSEKLEFIKNPVIFEFLGIPQNEKIYENKLESAIISNLKDVLLELGKGFAYVGRQYHIHTEKEEYFIDLVFYNYVLKCFVLIDLKTNKITHQDVGQMDMYAYHSNLQSSKRWCIFILCRI